MEHQLTRLHVPMIKKDKKNESIDDHGKDQTHAPIASATSCYVEFSVLH